MTNKEAIEVLSDDSQLTATYRFFQARDVALMALREKADKERRYSILEEDVFGPFRVMREKDRIVVANFLPTREAAKAIADIYKGVKQ